MTAMEEFMKWVISGDSGNDCNRKNHKMSHSRGDPAMTAIEDSLR